MYSFQSNNCAPSDYFSPWMSISIHNDWFNIEWLIILPQKTDSAKPDEYDPEWLFRPRITNSTLDYKYSWSRIRNSGRVEKFDPESCGRVRMKDWFSPTWRIRPQIIISTQNNSFKSGLQIQLWTRMKKYGRVEKLDPEWLLGLVTRSIGLITWPINDQTQLRWYPLIHLDVPWYTLITWYILITLITVIIPVFFVDITWSPKGFFQFFLWYTVIT